MQTQTQNANTRGQQEPHARENSDQKWNNPRFFFASLLLLVLFTDIVELAKDGIEGLCKRPFSSLACAGGAAWRCGRGASRV